MGGDQVGRLGGVMHGFHHYVRNATHRTAPQFRRHAAARRHATARRHFRTCGKIQHCSNCFRKLLRYRFFRDVFVGWKTAAVRCIALRHGMLETTRNAYICMRCECDVTNLY